MRWTAVLLLMVVVLAACTGIEPYEPRNNREEGPQKGLFTGSQGEWMIEATPEVPDDAHGILSSDRHRWCRESTQAIGVETKGDEWRSHE